MKKFIYLLFVLPLLLGCNPNNNTANPQEVAWKFEVTIDGTTHKAEGVGKAENEFSNDCFTTGTEMLMMQIADQSASSYISGNNGNLVMTFDNPSVGTHPLTPVNGSWFQDISSDVINIATKGYSLTSGGQMHPETNWVNGIALPVTITDLGTAGDGHFLGGTVMKANYSGTIYYTTTVLPPYVYDVPLDIDISFEAVRP